MYMSDSLSLCVCTKIYCALNVSQRAERGSAKEIKKENTVGQREKQRSDFQSLRGGEKLGKNRGKEGKG